MLACHRLIFDTPSAAWQQATEPAALLCLTAVSCCFSEASSVKLNSIPLFQLLLFLQTLTGIKISLMVRPNIWLPFVVLLLCPGLNVCVYCVQIISPCVLLDCQLQHFFSSRASWSLAVSIGCDSDSTQHAVSRVSLCCLSLTVGGKVCRLPKCHRRPSK